MLYVAFYFRPLDNSDYVNTAESILQKDVKDAYNTANDILKAEEALDKSEQPEKKKRTTRKHTVYGEFYDCFQ